jgi:hypothetical protein
MYHYLKWAALSLFFKRNLRYLLFIFLSLIGIYGADAVYTDLVEYFTITERKESILYLLLGKWLVVAGLIGLLLYSIMRLGFSKEGGGKSEEKRKPSKPSASPVPEEEDPVMKRLEKFREKPRLRRRSDLVMERMNKEKKR